MSSSSIKQVNDNTKKIYVWIYCEKWENQLVYLIPKLSSYRLILKEKSNKLCSAKNEKKEGKTN